MGIFKTILGLTLLLSLGSANAETKFLNLGSGWTAFTKQSDPFDSSKVEVIQIRKDSFIFRCNEMNMEAPSYGFESLSFTASLKYVVDANSPVDKNGGYSTYLGGSDLVTDDRYYYMKLSESDLNAFKKGNVVKVAGKYSSSGWFTKALNLSGFTKAYNKMCN
ncbi:hypothetical protein [Psychromonas algicola]|uniref:hypothetical protein n=1 Tax=Psychromonas algicola TaxID=2555642 RepID=UPI001067EADC|nr:hypothetical protein [Psychromonas sp. RZ5]TEW42986.1 hypothetical protein E2R67_16255 [Psychromonas sp. RZ5]